MAKWVKAQKEPDGAGSCMSARWAPLYEELARQHPRQSNPIGDVSGYHEVLCYVVTKSGRMASSGGD